MKLKFLTPVILIACLITGELCAQNISSKDQFINDLLSKMTIEEKVGQMNQYTSHWELTGPVPEGSDQKLRYDNIKSGKVGSMLNVTSVSEARAAQELVVKNSRLGIPLIFGYDVIHGFKTAFPIPLAQSASWDPEVARKSNEVSAREAAAAGINWTFAPMMDVTRDARWGRMMEGAGEDPYLASVMAKAWVEGYQGDDLSSEQTIAACAKHFAAYGFADGGRDYNTVDISEHRLHNMVLPPFKAAVESGVATVMNSFNEISGIPATAHVNLQRDILKGQWGFDGFVISDWGSIGETITHGYSEDTVDAAIKCITAGSDMDMEARVYETALAKLVENGTVKESLLDDAVSRILGVKYDLGLFEDPYRYLDEEREKNAMLTKENLAVARDAGRKSIVLLKNDDSLLPLSKKTKRIAVIGSLAGHKDVPIGSWRGKAVDSSAVSLLEGIKAKVSKKTKVNFAEGYAIVKGVRTFINELQFVGKDESQFDEAIEAAKNSDVVVIAMGEDCFQSAEGRSQTDIGIKGSQIELHRKIVAENPKVVVTLMNGRALDITELNGLVPAVVEVWHLGSEAGNAIADVIFGDYNPTGKLPVSFPVNVGQVPIYYNHKNTGRPKQNEHDAGLVFWSHYTDAPNAPLYPFGYGLSYASFKYENIALSKSQISKSETLTATVTLTNTSSVSGTETVQLYIRDHAGSVTRPVKELKGFQKITLEPGASKVVSFEIDNALLSYYRQDLTLGTEPGKYTVMIGSNSQEVLSTELMLTK